MKKSNLLFFILITVLCSAPFVIYGLSALSDDGNILIGFSNRYKVVCIENESLTPDRVKIETEGRHDATGKWTPFTSLYYRGKSNYAPSVRTVGDTIRIGEPKNADGDRPLTLHIRLEKVRNVWLNGREIWKK